MSRSRLALSCVCLLAAACAQGTNEQPQSRPASSILAGTPAPSPPDASTDAASAMGAGGSVSPKPVSPQAGTSAPDAGTPDAGKGSGELCTTNGECEERLQVPEPIHVQTNIEYPDPPPVGGPHNPCWGTWGVHAEPLPDDNWVHNLEHGGVILLYNCPEDCPADIAELVDFVGSHRRTLLTEYDVLPHRYAAVAWGYRIQMDTLDIGVLDAFYALHFDKAPESIDSGPGSNCP